VKEEGWGGHGPKTGRSAIEEEVSTSETSVYINKTTRHYIPEGCHLHNKQHIFLDMSARLYKAAWIWLNGF
jgi:hypothetical protein